MTITQPDVTPSGGKSETGVALNEFLNFAARSGNLSVQHMRHTVRQAETEAFTRKLAATFHDISPSAHVTVETTTIPSEGGAVVLNSAASDAAALELATHPVDPASPTAQYFMDSFSLFHAAARVELNKRSANTPAFPHSPVTVAASMSGHGGNEELLMAADSVYIQSFADVQAISTIASRGGAEIGLQVLAMVESRRSAGGDFGKYSTAPLSHDSSYALEILRGQLRMGKQFQSLGAAEIVENSAVMARDGLSVWLSAHGMDPKRVAGLTDNLAIIDKTLFTPPNKPAPATRLSIRSSQ